MKKIALMICIIITLLFCVSCSATSGAQSDTDYKSIIASLEAQLQALRDDKEATDSEYKQKIDQMSATIDELKSQEGDDKSDESIDVSVNVTPAFKYIVSGTTATLTGYTGSDKDIVIPASVDGYKVVAIGDGAFEGTEIQSVIISDGVESIGWFTFNGCVSLSSVTIPSSVTSIGYLAFGEGRDSLTVYCHSDSFALAYAQSYGLTYTVI